MSESVVENIINQTQIGTFLDPKRLSNESNGFQNTGTPERTTFSDINKIQDKSNSNSKENTLYQNLTTKENSDALLHLPKTPSVFPSNHQNFSCASFTQENKYMTVYERGRITQRMDQVDFRASTEKRQSMHKNQKVQTVYLGIIDYLQEYNTRKKIE